MFTVVPVFLQRFAEPDARRKYDDGRDEDDSKIPNSWALWGRHPKYIAPPSINLLFCCFQLWGFEPAFS